MLAAAGFLLLASADQLGAIVAGYAIFSLGLAPVFTLATDTMVGSVPPKKAGMASGIAETSSELGGALGIALLGSLVTAIYRGRMSAEQFAGIPAESRSRPHAGHSPARPSPPQQLGGEAGEMLLATAQDAFALGFSWASSVSAALALVGALLTIRAVRRKSIAESAS